MTALVYRAPPTLARFMRSDAFVRCVVGPVGSGKSSACVMEHLHRAVQQAPGPDKVRRTRFCIIRNTYGQLRDTTRKTFEQWIPPGAGRWKEQEFTFTLDQQLADGTRIHCEVLFRALDRPEDKKKLLSLELTGAYINEAREVPRDVADMLETRVGRYPSAAQGGCSWFGVWMDTNPWHTGHWGYKRFSKDRPEGYELFEQPGGRAPNAENTENLPSGYYDRLVAGKDAEWVAELVDAKYPSHDKGSVFGALVSALEARGAVFEFPFDTGAVFTSWDLGRTDSTAIWFWVLRPTGLDVVDHYENHGQALSHYFSVLEEKQRTRGYRYVKHWLPHDAKAKTLVSQMSILEQFIQRCGQGAVAIGPQLDLVDGLQAARKTLEGDIRFHARCDQSQLPGFSSGLEALRSYRYEYDEEAKVFKRTPVHDWTSHTADAFRYLSCVVQHTAGMMRTQEKPKPQPVRPARITLGNSWEEPVPFERSRV